MAETIAQKSGQNHDALVVGRSGKPGLALYIDNAGQAQRHGGGNPRRTSKCVAAHVDHRQAVDLADLGAFQIDDNDALGDQAAQFLLDVVKPQDGSASARST